MKQMDDGLQGDTFIHDRPFDHSLNLTNIVLKSNHNDTQTHSFNSTKETPNLGQNIQFGTTKLGSNNWKPINPKLAIYGDEYATPYSRTAIDYRSDGQFIMQACLTFFVLFQLSNRVIFIRIANAYVPMTGKARAKILHKFCTAGWKCVSYAGLVGMGIWALWDQQHWFWNPETYASIFYQNRIPWRIHVYYLTEISYYLFSCVSIFFEPQMKDRKQMLFHHSVTLALMLSSYYEYELL
jgi:hypothetical protein